MHTQLKVRIQIDFETVTLNDNSLDTLITWREVAQLNLEIFRENTTEL